MAKNEIVKRIEELERQRFFLAMKDRWAHDDYTYDRQMVAEIADLRKKL